MESLAVSVIIGLFIFGFLYHMSLSISGKYFDYRGIELADGQMRVFNMWVRNLCGAAAMTVFLVLFLFFLGQKLAYVRIITEGVEKLRAGGTGFIDIEGNNELTELAETINRMTEAQRELQAREEAVKREREDMIRAISHDIRTPLTSIEAYSQYMSAKSGISETEMKDYIGLVKEKADHITHMTDRLLDGKAGERERVEDGKLLMTQLAYEWEAVLEDGFGCSVDICLEEIPVSANIQDLKRIFDNLASNVKKYADPEKPVKMNIRRSGEYVEIYQENIRKKKDENIKSHGIGLKNVEQIAKSHEGDVKTMEHGDEFAITIRLKIAEDLQNSSELPA